MGAASSSELERVDRLFKLLDSDSSGELAVTDLNLLLPESLQGDASSLAKEGKVNLEALRETFMKKDLDRKTLEVISARLRIEGSKSTLADSELKLARSLADNGQAHLFKSWNESTVRESKPKALMSQLLSCHTKYPGGLVEYIKKARTLLAASKSGSNPFAGYTPEVPTGANLSFGDKKYQGYEAKGMEEVGRTAFVLVAGGLGERLGYGGIKIALPTEISSMTCYLQHYINTILAFQDHANKDKKEKEHVRLPLAIMTSGDTHELTKKLLDDNKHFGMPKDQIAIVQQDKVPALSDNNASFALDPADKFKIQTKPHGHGDVHLLLHQSGLAETWAKSAIKWVVFFQDTNGLVFNAIPACLGVSKELKLEVNSLTVPRKPGEAVGAICKLNSSKRDLTVNVEYNQLDALLKNTEVGGDRADEKTGLSPYPGNINILIFEAKSYAKTLQESSGIVPEFVNPKYKEGEKREFKKPTRLECMMQDYPRLCKPGANIGFTSMDRWVCFSAVKNNIKDAVGKAKSTGFGECGCTGEADMYKVHRKKLALIGVNVDGEGEKVEYQGVATTAGARIVLSPSFGVSLASIKSRFPSPNQVTISKSSTLVLDGNVRVSSLSLNGAMIIKAAKGAEVTVEEGKVENDGHAFKAVSIDDESIEEKFRIRGYVLDVKGQVEHVCDKAGKWLIKGGKATHTP